MPASLYYKWQDFYRLEPWGQQWENWLMAIPTKFFLDANTKKGSRNDIEDLMYKDPESKLEAEKERRERETASFFNFLDNYKAKG